MMDEDNGKLAVNGYNDRGSTWATRTFLEESWNSITHAFGAGMALCFLLFNNNSLQSKFLATGLLLTYTLSVIYHGISRESIEKKEFLRMLDMTAVHITIGTTIIAYLLAVSPPNLLLLSICPTTLSVAGVFFVVLRYDTINFSRYSLISYILNSVMGCGILYAAGVRVGFLGSTFIAGLIAYILGLAFYMRDHRPWYHTAWHVCVLVASILHMYGVYCYT